MYKTMIMGMNVFNDMHDSLEAGHLV